MIGTLKTGRLLRLQLKPVCLPKNRTAIRSAAERIGLIFHICRKFARGTNCRGSAGSRKRRIRQESERGFRTSKPQGSSFSYLECYSN